jgi:HPt (histidine-containing phosphotransfer) domain-containing protein
MITETMVLIALRQKNWLQASDMAKTLYENGKNSVMHYIAETAKTAESELKSEWLLTVWSELRWNEINDEEYFYENSNN